MRRLTRRLPPLRDLPPAWWRAGQRSGGRGVQRLEDENEIATAQLGGALRVTDPDGGELLEEKGDVVDHNIGTDRARRPGALEELYVQLLCPAGLAIEVLGWGEGPGKSLRQ